MSLKLCKKHKQESNHSHYADHNCDYCKAVAEIARLREEDTNPTTLSTTEIRVRNILTKTVLDINTADSMHIDKMGSFGEFSNL